MTAPAKAPLDLDAIEKVLRGNDYFSGHQEVANLLIECKALQTENARLRAMAEADAFEMGRVKEERDDAVKFLGRIGEEFINAGFSGGDRMVTLSNARSALTEIGRVKAENVKLVEAVARHVAHLTAMRREREEHKAAIGTVEFIDPPDWGSVTLAEQVARMREALATARRECEEYEAMIRETYELIGDGHFYPVETDGDEEITAEWEHYAAVRRAHERKP